MASMSHTLAYVRVPHNVLKLLGLLQLPGEAIDEEALALRVRQHLVIDHI